MKSLHTILLRALLLSTLILTSCSSTTTNGLDEEVTGPSEQYVEISVTEVSETSGNGKITYSAEQGTAWSAKIVEGDDFCSFAFKSQVTQTSGTVATSGVNNTLYFYYDENDYPYDRQATITFTFEGSAAVEFVVKQLSVESADSPYSGSDNTSPRWFELPTKVDDSNYLYVTHSTELNSSTVRNFSLCFDIESRAAAWVAYPFHTVYDGGVGRNERWTYDPKIPSDYQADLSSSYDGNYDRGHQMASADRQATVEMNRQTFYFSNMTPQLNTLNQQKWATLEGMVRDQVCADTLYVVTGADYSSNLGYTTDASGNRCAIPNAYFKVLLRTTQGNSGKAISECSATELQAIGFWLEHRKYDAVPDPVSVKEIETKTGFNFFPSIPEEVKASYKSSQWNF